MSDLESTFPLQLSKFVLCKIKCQWKTFIIALTCGSDNKLALCFVRCFRLLQFLQLFLLCLVYYYVILICHVKEKNKIYSFENALREERKLNKK